MFKRIAVGLLLALTAAFAGQSTVFAQAADDDLPVPVFDSRPPERRADELREAYLAMRRHLCEKTEPPTAAWQKRFEILLGELVVAQHRMLWAAAPETDNELVEYTRTLQPFYVKKDEIRGFLEQAARRNAGSAAEIRDIIRRLDENSRRFAEAANAQEAGRALFVVFANGAVLSELDKELSPARLRKFGIPEGDYAGRRNRASMALTDTLALVYPAAVAAINRRIPAGAPRFSVYYSTDYTYLGQIVKALSSTLRISFDLDKFEALQDAGWHSYAKTEFDDREQKRLRGGCGRETVRILFTPPRRADAENASKLLKDEGFEVVLRELAENSGATHKGLIYFQNRGTSERAGRIAALVARLEKVSPRRGTVEDGGPDYALWLIGGKTPPETPDLNGLWTAVGYRCNGASPTQIVRIRQTGRRITAVKTLGNDCVEAGAVTFRGNFDRNPFAVEVYTTFTDGPARFTKGTLRVVNANLLKLVSDVGEITLTRRLN
ncbi:MAG: hypothetical protein JSS81_13785 [Acidobacteria bacterium]|nr:hypothetical protein [Acidobacteriota bacterium]